MPGKAWDRVKIGPRPMAPKTLHSTDDLRDPAGGAKVVRCKCCGLPNPRDLVGEWCGLRGRLPICPKCWFEENPPDPLAA